MQPQPQPQPQPRALWLASPAYRRLAGPLRGHPRLVDVLQKLNRIVQAIFYLACAALLLLLVRGGWPRTLAVAVVLAAAFVLLSRLRARINAPRPYEAYLQWVQNQNQDQVQAHSQSSGYQARAGGIQTPAGGVQAQSGPGAAVVRPLFDEARARRGRSLPSRHLFSACAIAVAWTSVCTPVAVVLYALCVLLASIRLVGGLHFPRDLAWGAILGIMAGTAASLAQLAFI